MASPTSAFVGVVLWRKLKAMATIGKRNTLTVLRDSTSGIYLDGGKHGEILLPNRYVPRGVVMGDRLEVFVSRDSEDRLVATTETPRATVGEVATLKVISINRQVGAFLDWGLAKDLLLPFREQTGPVQVGQDVVVRIHLDEKTQRIVASMKLGQDSALEPPDFRTGQPVEILISDKTPLGYKALVEGKYPGLLYHEGISVPVAIGQKLKGFVRTLRPDGKIDLSLDQLGYRRVAPLALRIVQALQRSGGRLGLDEDTLLVWRLDRLGRSIRHLIDLVEELHRRGVKFKSLCDGAIDTTTASGELIFHIFTALAQFERRLIQERTNAGLKAARARGRLGGRPPMPLDDPRIQTARKLHADQSMVIADICKTLQISRPTLYRWLSIKPPVVAGATIC